MKFQDALQLSKEYEGSAVRRNQNGEFEVVSETGESLRAQGKEQRRSISSTSSDDDSGSHIIHESERLEERNNQQTELIANLEKKNSQLREKADRLALEVSELKNQRKQLQQKIDTSDASLEELDKKHNADLKRLRKQFYASLDKSRLEEIWANRESAGINEEEREAIRVELRNRSGFQPAPDAKTISVCSRCFLPSSACICRN